MTQKLNHGINAFLISIITLYLFAINKIGYFINSNYYWWLLLSVGFTFLMTIIFIFYTIKDKHQKKSAKFGQFVFSAILILVFSSFFIIPIKPLGAESATYTRTIVNKKDTQKIQYIAKTPEAISSLSLIDWFNIINQSPNASQYNGQKIYIKGFVSNTRADGFDLSLYQVSCCVVDAQLYTIPITSTNPIQVKDTWLNVKGTLEISGQKPNIKYQLKLIESEVIGTPNDPYISK
jgi:uncharacterized repeat protein (TIGR03943 family)